MFARGGGGVGVLVLLAFGARRESLQILDLRRLEGMVFITQTSDRMQFFTIFHDKLHSVNIQDNQLWALNKTVQKISEITYTASRFSLMTTTKYAVQTVIECLNDH